MSGTNGSRRVIETGALLGLLALAGLLPVGGCGGGQISRENYGETLQSSGSEADHLAQALEFLFQLVELEPAQAHRQIAVHLNEWVRTEPVDPDWIADPLAARLPQELARQTEAESLKARLFVQGDTNFLEETVWLRDLSRWAPHQGPPAEPQLLAWLKEQTSLSDSEREDLAAAERIFDWTIRNLQLVENRPFGTAAAATPAGEPARTPLVAPPGAQYWPKEALFLGRGDALVRARVAIGICRQRGIEAVMLSVLDEASKSLRAWAVGVFVGRQLFLFDPTLGLPIPGPQGRGIATLAQVQADEGLLRALDLSDTERYPFTKEDVAGPIAQIEAGPQQLSLRMKLLERHLTGDHRLVLTVQPSELATRLRQSPGLAEVRLWAVPFQANQFKMEVLARPDAYAQVAEEERPYVGPLPLAQGRQRHFRGEFQSDDDSLGAKQCYLSCMASETNIAAISSEEFRKQLLAQNPALAADPAQLAEYIAQQQEALREQRLLGAYYLGLASLDTGEFDVAANHLSKRVLADFPQSPVESGARYNLGRAYEALGKLAEARQQYEADTASLQRHGNHVRARRLAAPTP